MFIVQSYVDLITNSSTSIYQFANNPDTIKDIFNAVLQSAESPYIFDDLFTIETHYNVELEDTEEYYHPILDKYIKNDSQLQNLKTLYNSLIEDDKWIEAKEQWKLIINILSDKYGAITSNQWAEDYNYNNAEYKYSSYYTIKTKINNPEVDKTLNLINNLFDYVTIYNS